MEKESLFSAIRDMRAVCQINELKLSDDSKFWASASFHLNACLKLIMEELNDTAI